MVLLCSLPGIVVFRNDGCLPERYEWRRVDDRAVGHDECVAVTGGDRAFDAACFAGLAQGNRRVLNAQAQSFFVLLIM